MFPYYLIKRQVSDIRLFTLFLSSLVLFVPFQNILFRSLLRSITIVDWDLQSLGLWLLQKEALLPVTKLAFKQGGKYLYFRDLIVRNTPIRCPYCFNLDAMYWIAINLYLIGVTGRMKRIISRVRLVSSVVKVDDVSAMVGTRYVDKVRFCGFCLRGFSEAKHPFCVCCVRYINRKSYADCGWNAVYAFKNTCKVGCSMYSICNNNRAVRIQLMLKKAMCQAIYSAALVIYNDTLPFCIQNPGISVLNFYTRLF